MAVRLLEPGDVLLVAGKGHETGQIIGSTVLPFDVRKQNAPPSGSSADDRRGAAVELAEDAASATGDHPRGRWAAGGVSIDTRTLVPGDLFVALAGFNSDGHAFVADALDRGAAAAMVSSPPADLPAEAPLLLVTDTFEALRALGGAGRARTAARIAGILAQRRRRPPASRRR
ncbi:MAG: Mur ligase domain-containing protein [Rhodospirillales bacterium]